MQQHILTKRNSFAKRSFYSWVNPEPEAGAAIIASERALVSISAILRTIGLSLSRIATTKRSPRYLTSSTSLFEKEKRDFFLSKPLFGTFRARYARRRKRDLVEKKLKFILSC
jgi:hypothetical protein